MPVPLVPIGIRGVGFFFSARASSFLGGFDMGLEGNDGEGEANEAQEAQALAAGGDAAGVGTTA